MSKIKKVGYTSMATGSAVKGLTQQQNDDADDDLDKDNNHHCIKQLRRCLVVAWCSGNIVVHIHRGVYSTMRLFGEIGGATLEGAGSIH